jgi:hypothetical protein
MLRARPDFGPRLFVEFAIALDKTGLQRIDDHRRSLIEALPGLVHAQAESGELSPRQATSEAEAKPALAQHIEHRRLFCDAQWIVPRQDDSRGAQIDIGTEGGQIRHQLEVVRHERIVIEVVFGRPQAVEAQIGCDLRQPDLFVPYSRVRTAVPAITGEHHHHADIHRALLRLLSVARS